MQTGEVGTSGNDKNLLLGLLSASQFHLQKKVKKKKSNMRYSLRGSF
jgi:hypothetical protein